MLSSHTFLFIVFLINNRPWELDETKIKTMKKLVFFLALMLVGFTMTAQIPINYNGWYLNPNNPNDIVTCTDITNFVPNNHMLIIDTYKEYNTGRYYFKLTYIDDFFQPIVVSPPYTSVRYDNIFDFIEISDVKYDANTNHYVACGRIIDNYVSKGIIICFDANGTIFWSNIAYSSSNIYVTDYKRVEIAGDLYAACGDGIFSHAHAAIGFYDNTGACQGIYYTMFNDNDQFTSLVYNPNTIPGSPNYPNPEVVVVGKYYNSNTNHTGIIRCSFGINGTSISPPTTTLRDFVNPPFTNFEVISVALNTTTYDKYYVTGSLCNNNCDTYITELDYQLSINAGNSTQISSPFGGDIIAKDICYNPNSNPMLPGFPQLGVCGLATSVIGREGFLLEVNATNLNQPIPLGISRWSGYQNPSYPSTPFSPLDDEWFDNIIYRDNMTPGIGGNPINYSYIFHGGYDLVYNRSCIAEYYPIAGHPNTCQEMFYDYNPHGFNPIHENTTSLGLLTFNTNLPLNIVYEDNRLAYVCEPNPFYQSPGPHREKESKIFNNQNNFIYENGQIKLKDAYIHSTCNVFSVDGKLVLSKKEGLETISTVNLKPGVYFIQPLNPDLKSIKFNIIN